MRASGPEADGKSALVAEGAVAAVSMRTITSAEPSCLATTSEPSGVSPNRSTSGKQRCRR